MSSLLIPTVAEIEIQAASMFLENPELRESFIMGAYHTIYYNLKE